MNAVLSRDSADFAALYHAEAVQLPPGEPAVEGRGAIMERFARSRSDTETGGPVSFWGFSWSVDGIGGDLAYDHGMYQFQVTYEDGEPGSGRALGVGRAGLRTYRPISRPCGPASDPSR